MTILLIVKLLFLGALIFLWGWLWTRLYDIESAALSGLKHVGKEGGE